MCSTLSYIFHRADTQFVLVAAVAIAMCCPLFAADADFVGVLALAIEEDTAEKLGLEGEPLQKLKSLVSARELGVLELQDELKSLEEPERQAKLAEYRQESERQGLELLTDQQRERLEQIRIAVQGLASLADPKIAEQLQLSPEQEEQVQSLLAERKQVLAAERDENRRKTAEFEYERKLAQILSPAQRGAWSVLAGEKLAADDAPATESPDQPPMVSQAPGSPLPSAPTTDGAAPSTSPLAPAQSGPDPRATIIRPADRGPVAAPDPRAKQPGEENRLRFGFRYAPWKDVLDWLAEEAGYSLYFVDLPEGTFNYSSDSKTYTPAQAIDLLNSVLLTKGFMLVKREQILMLINLENGVPPSWVPYVGTEELDQRGEFELVSVLFTLDKFAPEEAEAEIRKLLGPQGAIVVLPKSKQILVTETAGRLKTIRRVVERVEGPESGDGGFRAFMLEHITVDEAMAIIRELLGIPKDLNSTDTIRIAPDLVTKRLLVSAPPDVLKKIEGYLKEIDKEAPPAADVGVGETLQLEIHTITGPDPNTVLQVLQTMLTGSPGVRLTVDPATGSVVALARPSEHATIQATIKQMQNQAQRKIATWTLAPSADATVVQLTVTQLLGGDTEEDQKKAPKMSFDPISQRMVAMGTESQIAQIEQLLQQFQWDANQLEPVDPAQRSTLRVLPNLTGVTGRNAAQLIEQYFPTMRRNRIRVVYPSQFAPGSQEPRESTNRLNPIDDIPWPANAPGRATPIQPSRPDARRSPSQPLQSVDRAPSNGGKLAAIGQLVPRNTPAPVDVAEQPSAVGTADTAAPRPTTRLVPAVFQQRAGDENPTAPSQSNPFAQSQPRPSSSEGLDRQDLPGATGDEVIIMVTPRGLVISSQDLDALDDVEHLLEQFQELGALQPEDFHVFYLKHTTAAAAAQTLDKVLGGGTIASDASGGGGGGLLGSLADSALGGVGGGLMRGILGLDGGGGSSSSFLGGNSVLIVPDGRLNALFISAGAADLDLIERLLTYIDQEGTPDTQVARKPRLIPVRHTSAAEIEKVVRQVYSDKLISGGGSSGQARQPSPEDFIRALRGGGGGGRGGRGGSEEAEDVNKMALGVDERSNSLVVSAPQQLFLEVEQLVAVLDQAASNMGDQASFMYTTKRTSPAALQQALQAIAGDKVKIVTRSATTPGATPPSSATAPTASTPSPRPGSSSGDASAREAQERLQRFMQMREMFQRGGDSGGSSGRGGSPFGGGSGGGDRGGSTRGTSGRGR